MPTSNYEIEAVETEFFGIVFRSKLEARWALFFQEMKIHWKYEPETFTLSNGAIYTPDFFLPQKDCYVEIKPTLDHLIPILKKIPPFIKHHRLLTICMPTLLLDFKGAKEFSYALWHGDEMERGNGIAVRLFMTNSLDREIKEASADSLRKVFARCNSYDFNNQGFWEGGELKEAYTGSGPVASSVRKIMEKIVQYDRSSV